MYPDYPCGQPLQGAVEGNRQQPAVYPYAVPQPSGSTLPAYPQIPPAMAASPAPVVTVESYVENILRMNRGKIATFYMTFENNSMWNARVFRGRIETAGRDHIIISEPGTGRRYILLMVNLDFVTFDEPINYIPPTPAT